MDNCWWGLHKWSKWITYTWKGLARNNFNQEYKITRTHQSRICDLCGIEQHRVVDNGAGARHGEPSDV